MAKAQGIVYYNVNKQLEIKCWWEDTRSGFRHLAQLIEVKSRRPILQTKAVYYNRTWEQYDYQSVIHDLISKSDIRNKQALKTKIDDKALGRVHDNFKTVGAVMALGEIFGTSKKESNDWKARMLKAGMGDSVQMPDDWEQLSEEDKEARLNKVIAEFTH